MTPEVLAQLRDGLEAMKRSSIDLNDYDGAVADVVFEIITADTYVAGIATKLLDRERVEPLEVIFVSKPFLRGAIWIHDGRDFDLTTHPAVLAAARLIERTREACARALVGHYLG